MPVYHLQSRICRLYALVVNSDFSLPKGRSVQSTPVVHHPDQAWPGRERQDGIKAIECLNGEEYYGWAVSIAVALGCRF
jgi:hypothetical protein